MSQVFERIGSESPDWSPCTAFRNQSDECGKEILTEQSKDPRFLPKRYSPVMAYVDILTKDHWVRTLFFILSLFISKRKRRMM